MATAILPSHSYLQTRVCSETLKPPLKSLRNSSPKGSHSRRHRRSPPSIQSSPQHRDRTDRSLVAMVPAKNMVMGQVRILKRGETLSQTKISDNRKPMAKKERDLNLVLGSTDRLGPDPETVQRQIRVSEFKVNDGIYGGSSVVESPPPCSLPVPGFLGKNSVSATSDLRRILRLDSV
ncbi:hypothetical protein I3760_15G160100 [Carya illinoinensis]|uniref:Uncharacterized protein n=1 Tax=Carya illinoinensis TaxID=32201 RepID=A0A8T1NE28_CARIL|nr:uncharacterized protein LOC122297041 [Carya illinoinensis]KAG2668428.1 hypothetical protein I3760_15G160100 [Carya illinoinensis]KAG6628122.1 hypothetical protein CIPAW_15G179300 [Carya illinoinensis]